MAKKAYVGITNLPKNVSDIYVGINNVPKKVIKGYVGVNGTPMLFYEKNGGQPSIFHRYLTLAQKFNVKTAYNFNKLPFTTTIAAMFEDVLYNISGNDLAYNEVELFRNTYLSEIYSDIAQKKTIEDTIVLHLYMTYYEDIPTNSYLELVISVFDSDATNKNLNGYGQWYLHGSLNSPYIEQKTKGFYCQYFYHLDTHILEKNTGDYALEAVYRIGRFYDYYEGKSSLYQIYSTSIQYLVSNVGVKEVVEEYNTGMIANFDFTMSPSTLPISSTYTAVFDKSDTDIALNYENAYASITNGKLTFNQNTAIYLPRFWLNGIQYNIEIDFGTNVIGGTSNFVIIYQGTYDSRYIYVGLTYLTNLRTWRWIDHNGDTSPYVDLGISDQNYFNNSTIKFEFNKSARTVKIYKNDTFIKEGSCHGLLEFAASSCCIGGTSTYMRFNIMEIKGLRVYRP